MIAIIGAMASETDSLKAFLQDKKIIKCGTFDFYQGKIFDKEVVIVQCGIGKVNSAAAASALLLRFNIRQVLSIGVAGGISKKVKKLDIVVANKCAMYDFDLSAIGLKKGQFYSGHSGFFQSDSQLLQALYRCAQTVCKADSVHTGTIITADKFMADTQESAKLAMEFDALACDMETAAIAQVADLFNTSFCGIRCISDGASQGANDEFDNFEQQAADISIKVIKEFLAS